MPSDNKERTYYEDYHVKKGRITGYGTVGADPEEWQIGADVFGGGEWKPVVIEDFRNCVVEDGYYIAQYDSLQQMFVFTREFYGVQVGSRYLKFWKLLRFALPHEARAKVYEPAYNDLLADYLETRQRRYQTPLARRWLNLCFVFRTVGLVLVCIGVVMKSRAWLVLLFVTPPGIRDWIRDWWYSLFRWP